MSRVLTFPYDQFVDWPFLIVYLSVSLSILQKYENSFFKYSLCFPIFAGSTYKACYTFSLNSSAGNFLQEDVLGI